MRKIGIVGSRKRSTLVDRQIVFDIVAASIEHYGRENIEIVSGACPKGADHFAAEAARFYGVKLVEFPVPTDPPIKHRGDFRERAYARNKLIAEYSDVLFALVHSSRVGGTENTISHAYALEKKVFLVDEAAQIYLSQDGQDSNKA